MTPGNQAIQWIEKNCCVPEGKFVGRPVTLAPFQKKIIRSIYDTPTRRAIISFGRKNAKTTLSAFLLLLHLCGYKHKVNSQLYSAAQSRDQAALLFNLAAKIVRMTALQRVVTIRDTAKMLVCKDLGTVYRALSAEQSTAYGLSPAFVVHDELGQSRGERGTGLFDAIETATGAQENPLSIIISTQAPDDGDLLSILIDDAQAGHDPRTKLFLYTAPEEDDPFDVRTIKKANPAFDHFMNKAEVLDMAESARRMPSREAEYRNLILNQRVETQAPWISPSDWDACSGRPLEDFEGLPVYAGLDLSATKDLTAFVMVAPHEGIWHVRPVCWLPEEGLRERSREDRKAYDLWASQGYLHTTPGRSIEYEHVALYLRDVFDKYDIRKLAFDRWNMQYLEPWLERVGFREWEIESVFTDFGQGTKSMHPALRTLESLILQRKLVHGDHPVLRMCARNSIAEMDASGWTKLSKKRSKGRGRIDAMVALTMAIGVAETDPMETEQYVTGLAVGV